MMPAFNAATTAVCAAVEVVVTLARTEPGESATVGISLVVRWVTETIACCTKRVKLVGEMEE